MGIKKKMGRPIRSEHREEMEFVGFKADVETMEALGELERALAQPGSSGRRRSQAIRKAILEARERLRSEKS